MQKCEEGLCYGVGCMRSDYCTLNNHGCVQQDCDVESSMSHDDSKTIAELRNQIRLLKMKENSTNFHASWCDDKNCSGEVFKGSLCLEHEWRYAWSTTTKLEIITIRGGSHPIIREIIVRQWYDGRPHYQTRDFLISKNESIWETVAWLVSTRGRFD